MTLLENICLIDRVQGGTIHQYIDIKLPGFISFEAELTERYLRHGAVISFGTLNKYARNRGLKINWSKDTLEFYRNERGKK